MMIRLSILAPLLHLITANLITADSIIFQNAEVQQACGDQITTDRIVGGNVTEIDEYPWMALLRYRNNESGEEQWGCGGTLIGTRTILTAAHCVEQESLTTKRQLIFVRMGEHDISQEVDCSPSSKFVERNCADPPMDFQIKSQIIHPERDLIRRKHDIAMLILDTVPPYTDFIRPICLPGPTIVSNLKVVFVAGWGSTTKNSDQLALSNVKLDARLDYINHTSCNRHYAAFRLNEAQQICAGGRNGTNACRGDSGGPLMEVGKTSIWYVVGVVQLGPKICGIDNRNTPPTVFARVTNYIHWINEYLE